MAGTRVGSWVIRAEATPLTRRFAPPLPEGEGIGVETTEKTTETLRLALQRER
jgi:hypothetical protein